MNVLLHATVRCIVFISLLLPFLSMGQSRIDLLSGASPLQRMWAELPENPEIVCKEYSWPGDDRLCDSYPGSDGPRVLRLFETSSGQLLAYQNRGAYCQGDSEYGNSSYFDLNGNLVLRIEGGNLYTSTLYTLFDKGRFVHFHEEPSMYDTPTSFDLDSNSLKPEHINDVVGMLEEMHGELLERLASLHALLPTLTEDDKEEAESLIRALEEKETFQPEVHTYTLRLPSLKELEEEPSLFLAGEHINLFTRPDFDAEILGYLTYTACCVQLLEYGATVESTYAKNDQWLRVRYSYADDEGTEGWILKSGVQRKFFPL